MARYIDMDKLGKMIEARVEQLIEGKDALLYVAKWLNLLPEADVAPRAEVFEEVDKFRTDLMNKFIDLCRGNDYNKLTLLKIGDVVDEMYDRRIANLKKKYTEGKDDT